VAGLGLTDVIWLLGESRERPLNVGGLMLFELPDGVTPADVRDQMRSPEHPLRHPFDQRLGRPNGRAGRFTWVDDEVDLDHHLRHVALPAPGRIRELLAYVSQQHGSLLDRHRPLWEAVLIEGVEGGRIALYCKVHHAMLDGMAAMKQLTGALTTDPDERGAPPPWAARSERPPRDREGGRGLFSPVAAATRLVSTAVGESVRAAATVGRLGAQVAAGVTGGDEVVPYLAPRSMFNTSIASARRIVAQSYDLARFRAAATAHGTTVNDVILAVCGGALRTYLQQHDALPDDPLIAMVPVSLRPKDVAPEGVASDGGDRGNAVSMMLASLGTDVAGARERLERVKASMDAGKTRLAGMTQLQLIEYAALLLAPLGTGQMLRISGERRPLFNVIISNVPGPREPLYWNGARLTGMYPLSAVADGYALNITLISYAGSLEVGITADRASLPRVQRLIDHLEDSLAELEAA
jgi:diacylglycerol O-acyltransferase